MRDYFYDLAAFLEANLQGLEHFRCWLNAESSEFVRFNSSAIRQPGHVLQNALTLTLIDGRRHASSTVTLAGNVILDRPLLQRTMAQLRGLLPDLPEDPHMLVPESVQSTEHVVSSSLPPAREMVEEALDAARGYDFVGILSSGPLCRGFANSEGQRNWHEASSFNLDWSLYLAGDKAVKATYAGYKWDPLAFRTRFAQAASQLDVLGRPAVTLEPGEYRAYLTPTALGEMLGMFNWGGLAEKAMRSKRSSLRRMRDEGVCFSQALTLSEDLSHGLTPGFQSDGFIKPQRLTLIDKGQLVGSLISPRTGKEFGIATNGADPDERMSAFDVAPGELPVARVLAELGTGIYISNLWYLNFSDRGNCRLTGMTRFATLWVEDGKIKAPLNVMRFDDSLFRVLGDKLLALTQERDLLIDGDSYGERRVSVACLPGALVKDLRFVL